MLVWACLAGAMWHALRRVGGMNLEDVARLLPEVVGLARRLIADPTVSRVVRWRLWLLIGYLALPFDIVPDFVPVIGHLDDALVVALVFRSVLRRAGVDAIRRNWRGTGRGLQVVLWMAGGITRL